MTWLHEMGVDEGATDCQIISHTGVDTHYAGVDREILKVPTNFKKSAKLPQSTKGHNGIIKKSTTKYQKNTSI